MAISRRSATPELIQKMAAVGMKNFEIARKLGCTASYVSVVLSESTDKPRSFLMPALSPDEWDWLRGEATRLQISVRDCAKALLVDAINDAREQEK